MEMVWGDCGDGVGELYRWYRGGAVQMVWGGCTDGIGGGGGCTDGIGGGGGCTDSVGAVQMVWGLWRWCGGGLWRWCGGCTDGMGAVEVGGRELCRW